MSSRWSRCRENSRLRFAAATTALTVVDLFRTEGRGKLLIIIETEGGIREKKSWKWSILERKGKEGKRRKEEEEHFLSVISGEGGRKEGSFGAKKKRGGKDTKLKNVTWHAAYFFLATFPLLLLHFKCLPKNCNCQHMDKATRWRYFAAYLRFVTKTRLSGPLQRQPRAAPVPRRGLQAGGARADLQVRRRERHREDRLQGRPRQSR